MVVVIRDLQPLHILDQFRAVVAVTSASGHSRSWGRDESCATCYGVPFNVVTPLEFLPVRRRYEGHGYAVSTSVPVRFGPGEDEQVFRLLSWPVFAPVGVELRKGVVRHAPSPLGPRVGHDGDVLLNVDCVFAELFK